MSNARSTPVVDSDPTVALARDVAEGLTRSPKAIPSRYLYDDLGSKLFEAICHLPWYRITRAERRLLERHADDIASSLGATPTIIELGAGSGEKLSLLFDSISAPPDTISLHLVDISSAALDRSVHTLARHDFVQTVCHEAPYEEGLQAAVSRMSDAHSALVLFLGSNIGNMNCEESARFLRLIRQGCRPGDRLLLGADLVKPEAELMLAYGDPLGITAAFNLNLLERLNRELDGDFDLGSYDHQVVWNAAASRVESYLVSREDQLVCLRGAGCCVSIAEGEGIWTESSYKYEPESIVDMAKVASFALRHQWIEPEDRFALTLFEAVPESP